MPSLPVAIAIGTVVSPILAPISITKSPGWINFLKKSIWDCEISTEEINGLLHFANSIAPSFSKLMVVINGGYSLVILLAFFLQLIF